jgi:16S rRNA (adenine1518-N6/adenine1519-N6)-dimethyltransferase
VDSVVLRLVPETPVPAALDPALLHRLVKTAFGHRRKTLNNTLVAGATVFGLSPEEMRALLGELNIDLKRRGETLSVAEFVEISNQVAQLI